MVIEAERIRSAVLGIGVDVLMACSDPSIVTQYRDAGGITVSWTAAAPEQVEAHILQLLTTNLKRHTSEGDTLNVK